MSILIKGEKMPESCTACQMSDTAHWYECPFYAIDKSDYSKKRFDKCPLVEVPEPHGRLIDADTIDDHIVGSVDLRDVPTVIEAEGEEHEY